jgi:hypothetical protein
MNDYQDYYIGKGATQGFATPGLGSTFIQNPDQNAGEVSGFGNFAAFGNQTIKSGV